MEPVIFVLIFLAILVAGVGTSFGVRRKLLSSRQQRWHQLSARFDHVMQDSTGYELDPNRALAAPVWLDRTHPLVRGFSASLKRAQQRRSNLEFEVPRTRNGELNPSDEQLDNYELLVERLEESYRETDRAVRSAGALSPTSSVVPHHQFLLDPRWGRPAQYPPLGPVEPEAAVGSVKAFLDGCFPIQRTAAQQALRRQVRVYQNQHNVKKAMDFLLKTGRYQVDAQGFLWPASVNVEHWGVHRTFGAKATIGLAQIPLVEIANAAWLVLKENTRMTEHQLQQALIEKMELNTSVTGQLGKLLHDGLSKGLESLGSGILLPTTRPATEQLLHHGIQEALVTGRLQRHADGTLSRLRTTWPVSYRI